METLIQTKERVYAQKVSPKDVIAEREFCKLPLQATEWFGRETEPLQGSLMMYKEGKTFRTHKHVMNPRIINRTQEVFIVAEGEVTVDIYEKQENVNGTFTPLLLGSLTAKQGEAIFVWAGFHKITVRGVVYEIKAGQFNGVVSDDKEFLDGV